MPAFFNKFPVISYDTQKKIYSYQNSQFVTNILFRVAIIREVMTNISSYFEYTINDSEKPEVLADKFYNDPEAHWIILYANDIFDPQYDWPLDSRSFPKYLADKYRAQAEVSLGAGIPDFRVVDWTRDTTNVNSIHHYEKIITRENSVSKVIDEKRIEINKNEEWLTHVLDVPFDTYDNLPSQTVEFFNLSDNNVTITQTTTKNAVTYYDYEEEMNEKKRNIKIIKKMYYGRILSEFNNLTNAPVYSRRLIV